MRYYGIDDRYILAAESVTTLPAWDAKYTRSFIFDEATQTMYYGTGTGWAPCSANVAAGTYNYTLSVTGNAIDHAEIYFDGTNYYGKIFTPLT